MNLFVAAIGLPRATTARIPEALASMTEVLPLLDPATVKSWHTPAGLLLASIHVAPKAAAPRIYTAADLAAALVYDGCPLDRKGALTAYDAAVLNRHWAVLPDTLEGQFACLRLDKKHERLELLTDPYGMVQVYYAPAAGGWLISNNVQLLQRVTGQTAPDPLGVSLFLGMGWAGGDRTLLDTIRVVPPGQLWMWQEPDRPPQRKTYFDFDSLARRRQAGTARPSVDETARDMADICRGLQALSPVECPITAGRDSRLLVALLQRAGVDATYFSSGAAEDADVRIGVQIAERLGLSHRIEDGAITAAEEDWDQAIWRLIHRTDGMVTLAHVSNALHQPAQLDALGIHLYGAGGELARGNFFEHTEYFYLIPQSRRSVQRHLTRAVLGRRGSLMTPAARDTVTRHLHDFVSGAMACGFSARDVEAAFYFHERIHRWAGANLRQVSDHTTVCAPLCTRPYARAAMATPAVYRWAERLPHRLLQALHEPLHGIPFEHPWRPQTPAAVRARLAWLASDRYVLARLRRKLFRNRSCAPAAATARHQRRRTWLAERLGGFRSLCLDQAASPLWDYVDRQAFERATADPARLHLSPSLMEAVTLFHYRTTLHHSVPVDAANVAQVHSSRVA